MKYEIYIYRKNEDLSCEELFYMSTKDSDKLVNIICGIAQVLDENSIEGEY